MDHGAAITREERALDSVMVQRPWAGFYGMAGNVHERDRAAEGDKVRLGAKAGQLGGEATGEAKIVRVHPGQKFAAGGSDAIIEGANNASVGATDDANARIPRRQLIEDEL